MAHCPVCGQEISAQARYCPHCGARQQNTQPSPEQLKLPGVNAGAATPGAGGADPPAPEAGTAGNPLSVRQVAITVGVIMLFLLGFIYYVGNRSLPDSTPGTSGDGKQPVVGKMNEPITVGHTVMGVAFTQSPDRINDTTPKNGRFLAVGVVIGNHGSRPFTLDKNSFGLTDGKNDGTHQPMLSAYGTLEELKAGQYHATADLPPGEALAAILVFDIAQEDTSPLLLIRDLTQPSKEFTGSVDLTKEAPSPPSDSSPSGGTPPTGLRPQACSARWK